MKKMLENTYHMKESDLLLLITYLKHGYSLQEALPYFPKAYQLMNQKLEDGNSFESLLVHYVPKAIKADFCLYIQMMSIESALEAAIDHHTIHHLLQSEIQKKSIYPLFLLGLAFSLLQLFSQFVVPLIFTSFTMMNNNDTLFTYIQWMELICNLTMCLIFIFMIISCLCLHPKIKKYLILTSCRYLKGLRIYISYTFASAILPLLSQGIPTIDMMLHLSNHNILWIRSIARRIHLDLSQGYEFTDSFQQSGYFDHELIQTIERGLSLSSLESMITFYIELSKNKLLKLIKQLTLFIQICAYTFIALLVVLVFQIMLLPLSILETI